MDAEATRTSGGPQGSRTRRALQLFERHNVRISVVICLLLAFLFFWIPKVFPEAQVESYWPKTIVSFVQSVASNTLPVFLLFALSVWLFREIRQIEKEIEREALVDSLAGAVETRLQAANLVDSVASAVEDRLAVINPDRVFHTKTSEEPILATAEHEVLLVQETASLLSERCKSTFINLLRRGVVVKLIVVDTTSQGAALLAFRNANLDEQGIRGRASLFNAHLRDLLKSAGSYSGKFHIRFLPYPVCSTSVIVDSAEEQPGRAKALVRLSGFRIPFDEKLDFQIVKSDSPDVFFHYRNEFHKLYRASSKILLITSAPRTGKTGFMEGLLKQLNYNYKYFWSLSVSEIGPDGTRKGFLVKRSQVETPTLFAQRKANGEYDVDTRVWDQISVEIELAAKAHIPIILDEIGPLQLRSEKFTKTLEALLESTSSTVLATIAMDDSKHSLLSRWKNSPRAMIFSLEQLIGSEKLQAELVSEIVCSAEHGYPFQV